MVFHFHPFHIVSLSPWPLLAGLLSSSFFLSFLLFLNQTSFFFFLFNFLVILTLSFLWWRDVTRESSGSGDHTFNVQENLKWGISLFIFSEVVFFAAWFWSFFHNSTVPLFEVGLSWPPLQVIPFDPIGVPLLNTAILLSSGVFVTWAHHNVLLSRKFFHPLLMTILLGLVFSLFQAFEYNNSGFALSDSAFGTCFFITTGFHGLHVIVGTLFLSVCLFRESINHLEPTHHIGFEFSIWYWHFVDIVWLFLFSFVYWWTQLSLDNFSFFY